MSGEGALRFSVRLRQSPPAAIERVLKQAEKAAESLAGAFGREPGRW
jgi:hypothetical protein